MKQIILILFTLALVVACAPKTTEVIEVVSEPDAESTIMRKPSLEESEGMALYNANCNKCHDLEVISNYSLERWTKIVPDMSAKAKLNAVQESKIMAYVKWQLGK